MSLINDALKRANQTMKPNPNSVGGIRLEPAHSGNQNFFRLLVVPLILVVLAGAGGWFLWKAKKQQKEENARISQTNGVSEANRTSNTSNATSGKTITTPAPAPTTNKNVTAQKTTPKTTQKSAQPPIVPNKEAISPELPKPVVTVKPTNFPTLKVQTILPLRSKPSTMINSRLLSVGDSINGATVVVIAPDHVVVEFQGFRDTNWLK